MSPARERDSSVSVSKPYSRSTTPDAPPEIASSVEKEEPNQTIPIASKPGFPTYEQYKEIEATYLKALASTRREKALISQALFDRIWAVLHCHDHSDESPQFRFWVRKKFTLGKLRKDSDGSKDKPPSDSDSTPSDSDPAKQQIVLLHREEQNLIAVREQIYDILCYGHGISNHGGRDKTASSVKEHYTWIPKELIAQFIKACPTCIAKKFGMKDADTITAHTAKTLRRYLRNFGAIGDSDDEGRESLPKPPVPLAASRPEIPREMPSILPSESIPMDRCDNFTAPADLRAPQSAAMSREVSLYQGLPNGWQFRHSDFAAAQDEFMISKNSAIRPSTGTGARVGRPRVPSIAPMMRAFSEPPQGQENQNLNAFAPQRLNDSESHVKMAPSSPGPVTTTLQAIPGSPRPSDTVSDNGSFEFLPSPYSSSPGPQSRPAAPTPIRARAVAPLMLDLQALNSPTSTAAQEFMDCSTPERHSSVPSNSANLDSPLYTLAMVAATESMSPPNTALPTPVDSVFRAGGGLGEMFAKDLGQKTGMTMVNISTEAVCDHGPGVVVL